MNVLESTLNETLLSLLCGIYAPIGLIAEKKEVWGRSK